MSRLSKPLVGAALTVVAITLLACGDSQLTSPTVARAPDATLPAIGTLPAAVGAVMFGVGIENRLVSFSPAAPQVLLSSATVRGLAQGERLIGIDFRPADGALYGVSDRNVIYTINTETASAARIGTSALSTAINSRFIGFDFNPAADRIRVHSDTEQNLRLNPALGSLAAVDTSLAYQPEDRNFGRNPGISGTAYTNSTFNNGTPPASTVLYAIDAALGVLVTLPSPNSGKLKTVGSLGPALSDIVGFDIAGTLNTAYASFASATTGSRLYVVNLATGSATLLGTVGSGNIKLVSLTAAVK